MLKQVILATRNAGKIRELTDLLKPLSIEVVSQLELGIPEIEEVGLSFIENAILKARHASKESGLPAIADDSGLSIKSLNGAPGIYSARYSGANASAVTNIAKVLNQLKNIPDEKRQAHFHCSLAFLTHALDPTPIICEGKWEGKIMKDRHGANGFGYDPIFFDEKEQKTAAELSITIKNKISHRAKALQKLIVQLSEL